MFSEKWKIRRGDLFGAESPSKCFFSGFGQNSRFETWQKEIRSGGMCEPEAGNSDVRQQGFHTQKVRPTDEGFGCESSCESRWRRFDAGLQHEVVRFSDGLISIPGVALSTKDLSLSCIFEKEVVM